MKKTIGILLALALVLSFSLVTATPVAAATINVPSDYGTIQAAVDAASSGATIMVEAGHSAAENLIITTTGLTLTTDENNPATIVYDASGTTATIDISADGVTVENFKIERKNGDEGAQVIIVRRSDVTVRGANITGPDDAFGIYLEAQNDGHIDLSIVDNTFEGLWDGIVVDTGGSASVDIRGNTFDGVGYGVYLYRGTELEVLIEGNSFKGTGAHTSILANDAQATSTLWNVSIIGNTFDSFRHGIYLYRANELDVVIEDNALTNMVWGGVTLWDTDGPSTSWKVTIDSNHIAHNPRGIYLYGFGAFDVSITSNRIVDNTDNGVYVYSLTPSDVVTINYNSIEGNSPRGIYHRTGPKLDGRWNWWGDASGAYHATGNPGGKGDAVSTNVDFMPWLMEEDGAETTETNTGFDVDASAGTSSVSAQATGGDGTTTVTVAEYVGNPTAVDPGFAAGAVFFDVHVGGTEPNTLVVEFNCPGGDCSGTVLRWFDGSQWRNVTPVSYTNGTIMATLSDTSSPTIAQLTGTPFGLGGPMAPAALPAHIVGWETYPLNKATILAPWIALLAAIMAGTGLLVWRRRRAMR